MKVIIAGPRECNDYALLCEALENCPFTDKITEVVSGGAKGVDKMGERWAKENNKKIKIFPAKWDEIELACAVVKKNKWGKEYNVLAGVWRNQDMVNYSEALIAIDLGTDGTSDIIKKARDKGLYVFTWPQQTSTAGKVYDF